MKIAHIQLSVHGTIWSCYASSSSGSSRLNKVLFSLRRFHHYRLTKKKLARKSNCHWH
ncbi:hypothetical protein Ahy_A03g012053 [Arachis hypogaea]|uniref:Uncharacterized protein n=1 Tax=Arachis hypogaea TaxID=3818 RepID=A0A445DSE7_ARAHY|nr:hypothetical protein Ahy_B03g063585 [Arachis hypogaea]RYR66110.1 hypothetical protein Ahy_A03g012053 [Arachis hypogaea]